MSCNAGPLFATYPHNDSCWRAATNSYFAFDVQPHYHVGDSCFGENDPSAPFYFNGMYVRSKKSPVATENLLANTDGVLRFRSIPSVFSRGGSLLPLFMLTAALLIDIGTT